MIYIVTVHYALRIEAEDMDEAQAIAEKMVLTDKYVPNSWEIPDIHEDHRGR